MSDLETITNENQNLKKQIEQTSAGVDNLMTQLQAYKDALTDMNNLNLNLRSNLIATQKQYQQIINGHAQAAKQVNDLTDKLRVANQLLDEEKRKIAELTSIEAPVDANAA